MEETVKGGWPCAAVVRSRRREPEPESGVGKEALTPAIEVTRAKPNQNHRPERVSVPRGIGCVAQKENAG